MLLRFLAGNSKVTSALKTSGEAFAQILTNNLHSPAHPKTWSHLINDNLNTICYRKDIWDLATMAILTSTEIHRSWAVTVDGLHQAASHPSSKVSLLCSF